MITQSGLGDYLLDAANMGASDLHVTAGLPPMVRISGKVEPLDYPILTTNATRDLIYDLLSNDQRQRLENEWEIDFLHEHKQCIVNQREVNQDTKSFAQALKHVLRQDPDVILVGEMRDLETIALAITAAETGHLVFGTLHTQDAPQTVDRIID